jgi:hypothetical protein
MSNQQAKQYYAARIEGIRQQEAEIERQSRSLRRWRALTWLPALGLAAYATFSPADDRWMFWLAGGLFAAFVVVLGIHEQALERSAMLARRRRINQQQIDRLRRDWSQVAVPVVEIPSHAEAVARDLDLFGKASLFHWLCLAHTPLGVEMLRDWLLTPAAPLEVVERQEAVRRLATATELREELQLRGQLLVASGKGPARFLAWAESPGWLATHSRLAWCVRLLSAAMLLMLAAVALTPFQLPALGGIGLLLTINVVVNLGYVPAIHDLFEVVASRQNDVAQYRAALGLLRDLPTDCVKFQQLRARLGPDAEYPLRCLDHLGRRVHLAAARHSSLWGLPYLILQWLFLCDFHVLAIIETWQRRHGREARQWFEALAELETLASLACVAHDNPSWCYPDVDPEGIKFQARQLGHPLLRDELRVANDVEVGPAGTFLLVSGSNMSGKSTLLRSVGVNVILAQAGAPICAAACQLPPLEVATSMRIGDSLADGVSFYMAELKRLKQVVDQADGKRSTNQPQLLYLLDEILLGTNSAERHIAVVRVLRHLLDSGAIGAVSTHDLELATSSELERGCRPVHFREQIVDRNGRPEMTFDYRMRPGVATTTNALKLLELVGLG